MAEVERELQELGEREIRSTVIGETVMRRLRELDEVAYVRFASVYRAFRDMGEFMAELERLARKNSIGAEESRPHDRAGRTGAGRRSGSGPGGAPSAGPRPRRFMSAAVAAARRGLGRTSPNPAVGAVVVRGGRVVGARPPRPRRRPPRRGGGACARPGRGPAAPTSTPRSSPAITSAGPRPAPWPSWRRASGACSSARAIRTRWSAGAGWPGSGGRGGGGPRRAAGGVRRLNAAWFTFITAGPAVRHPQGGGHPGREASPPAPATRAG